MRILTNPFRGRESKLIPDAPFPSTDVARVAHLLGQCPRASKTPLLSAPSLAPISALWIKDERTRMGLGSFKALGAAYVIARQACEACDPPTPQTLKGRTYVTASAGNHGISVAAGARLFGATAVVYISQSVPESFAARLSDLGARVTREGADYATSMDAAQAASRKHGWTLLSDSSWQGYTDLPYTLMEGYLQMAAEAVDQCPDTPSHIFLQAGVGGLAGAVAAYARKAWGDAPQIIVVEPEAAPALQASIEAGKCVFADGPDSVMGRLDCKEPSWIALNGLARDADTFVTLSDGYVTDALSSMAAPDLATTPSGGAGIAAVMHPGVRDALGIGPQAKVLCFMSEVPD